MLYLLSKYRFIWVTFETHVLEMFRHKMINRQYGYLKTSRNRFQSFPVSLPPSHHGWVCYKSYSDNFCILNNCTIDHFYYLVLQFCKKHVRKILIFKWKKNYFWLKNFCQIASIMIESTLGIWIVNFFGIHILGSCLLLDWFAIQMPSTMVVQYSDHHLVNGLI